ncbi:MAG: tripartite tricarboxylate transporter substrate binding protein [Rhodovarius sp.]|nr:tripartite tricarboxylate transporter substrate binding protein [Rhodovarius sp.]MDW8313749.1 tripartite tricarboxylate transporter substrate binding protein [Rhodovarius sp.]
MQRRLLITAAASLPLARPRAQGFPDRPIRLIVPFAAGGNADTVARILAPRLQERLGQPVVVENRPGAGGSLGAEVVARARADGHTLLIGSNGPLSVNPVVQARLPYDPARDLQPIGMAMQVPHCLMVQPTAPWQELRQLIAASRAAPDTLGVGTAGVASATHLALEAFKAASGARLLHVPYRGGGAALPDFLAGNVPILFTEFSTALPIHRDRRGRMLAVAAAARLPAAPEVPTMAEAGVPGFTAASYVGLVGPAGLPAPVLATLAGAFAAIVAEEEFRARMAALGGEAAPPALATPGGFAAFIAEDLARSRAAAEAAGIRPE